MQYGRNSITEKSGVCCASYSVRTGMVGGTYGDGQRSCAVYDRDGLTGPSQGDRQQSPL